MLSGLQTVTASAVGPYVRVGLGLPSQSRPPGAALNQRPEPATNRPRAQLALQLTDRGTVEAFTSRHSRSDSDSRHLHEYPARLPPTAPGPGPPLGAS